MNIRNLLYSNLRYKINEANMKIGDVETKAGMTPGYLSKMQKEESKNNNVLDFVVNAASILKVSVDSLVHVDYSSLTKTEQYFADFIDKIIRETNEGFLCWSKETQEQLSDYAYQSRHPLFKQIDKPYTDPDFEYDSHYERNVSIGADCYNVEIKEATLYLMNINSKENPFGIELYFVKEDDYGNKQVINICNIGTLSPLEKLGSDLNAAAKESSNHIKLDKDAKNIIDNYMIPF